MSESELPRFILEEALRLKDPLKNVYLALYNLGKPSSAKEVAETIDFARAYVHMRLNQLADMGKVVRKKGKHGKVSYEVIGPAR